MSQKPKLVVSRKIFEPVLQRLAATFDVVPNQDDVLLTAPQLMQRVADADALFCVGSDRIDAALLQAAPRLKMVATGTVGFNHIDLASCAARGIQVSNTPDVLTETTADFGWALMMAAARRVAESERYLRAGQWDRWAFDQFLGTDLYGATLGIVGMGRIGGAIARRAQGFAMRVIYHNRRPAEHEYGARWTPLPDLLREADFVMLVVPYSAATHHLIDAAALRLMRPTSFLINLARGGVVDDAALAQALHQHHLAGAALDVFEGEPSVHPQLLTAPNVLLTPHIASASLATRLSMAQLAADNLIAFADGHALKTPVALPAA